MKLTIIGYGKMGKMVEKFAQDLGHEIISIVDPSKFGNKIDAEALKNTDVCIDFTNSTAVLNNIERVISFGKDMVVGTTGWENHKELVKKWVETSQTGFLYGSNFSLGVNLFLKVIEKASKIFAPFIEYDIGLWEGHHKHKLDTPSGTAKSILYTIEQETNRASGSIAISSTRCGSLPGSHMVIFDSPQDTITFTHEARNREGFAQGAIKAAEWLKGKRGFYTFSDLCEK
jgi:4-hydroxy-tetrahydrodipicolinate reductase